jgi:hypothetical protein
LDPEQRAHLAKWVEAARANNRDEAEIQRKVTSFVARAKAKAAGFTRDPMGPGYVRNAKPATSRDSRASDYVSYAPTLGKIEAAGEGAEAGLGAAAAGFSEGFAFGAPAWAADKLGVSSPERRAALMAEEPLSGTLGHGSGMLMSNVVGPEALIAKGAGMATKGIASALPATARSAPARIGMAGLEAMAVNRVTAGADAAAHGKNPMEGARKAANIRIPFTETDVPDYAFGALIRGATEVPGLAQRGAKKVSEVIRNSNTSTGKGIRNLEDYGATIGVGGVKNGPSARLGEEATKEGRGNQGKIIARRMDKDLKRQAEEASKKYDEGMPVASKAEGDYRVSVEGLRGRIAEMRKDPEVRILGIDAKLADLEEQLAGKLDDGPRQMQAAGEITPDAARAARLSDEARQLVLSQSDVMPLTPTERVARGPVALENVPKSSPGMELRSSDILTNPGQPRAIGKQTGNLKATPTQAIPPSGTIQDARTQNVNRDTRRVNPTAVDPELELSQRDMLPLSRPPSELELSRRDMMMSRPVDPLARTEEVPGLGEPPSTVDLPRSSIKTNAGAKGAPKADEAFDPDRTIIDPDTARRAGNVRVMEEARDKLRARVLSELEQRKTGVYQKPQRPTHELVDADIEPLAESMPPTSRPDYVRGAVGDKPNRYMRADDLNKARKALDLLSDAAAISVGKGKARNFPMRVLANDIRGLIREHAPGMAKVNRDFHEVDSKVKAFRRMQGPKSVETLGMQIGSMGESGAGVAGARKARLGLPDELNLNMSEAELAKLTPQMREAVEQAKVENLIHNYPYAEGGLTRAELEQGFKNPKLLGDEERMKFKRLPLGGVNIATFTGNLAQPAIARGIYAPAKALGNTKRVEGRSAGRLTTFAAAREADKRRDRERAEKAKRR